MPAPLHVGWWERWRRALLAGGGMVVLFKLATELVALLTATGHRPGGALLAPWNVWDTQWWTSIAAHGYPGAMQPGADSTAFAPAFPLLVRAVMVVVPGGPLVSAMLVSTVALLFGAVVLFRVVETRYGTRAAMATVAVLLTFPAAFFLGAPYSEAVSLAAVAGAMYGMQRERWGLASSAAAVAMLSKYVFVLVPVAVAIEYAATARRRRAWLSGRDVAAIALPPLIAAAGWLAYMQATFRSPLRFLSAERTAWLHSFTWPWVTLQHVWNTLAHPDTRPAWLLTNVIDDLTIVATVALAVWMLRGHWRREQPGWTAMAALTAALFLCMGVPNSAARYLLPIAPAFAVLGIAAARHPRRTALVLLCSAALMLGQLSHFTRDLWTG